MKKVLFLAVFGVLVPLAAGGPATAQSSPDHPDAADCRESGPLPNQIRCFLDAAEAQDDVTICEGAYDFAVRFNCVSKFAENAGDPAACERIPIRNNRMLLVRDSCISGVAAATRTPQLCEQVQLDVVRDSCFLLQVLDFEASADWCELITRAAVRRTCLEPTAAPR